MLFGTVKFFHETRQFGFITADDGTEHFLGRAELERSGLGHVHLEKGLRLAFMPRPDRKNRGSFASEIRLASGDDSEAAND